MPIIHQPESVGGTGPKANRAGEMLGLKSGGGGMMPGE